MQTIYSIPPDKDFVPIALEVAQKARQLIAAEGPSQRGAFLRVMWHAANTPLEEAAMAKFYFEAISDGYQPTPEDTTLMLGLRLARRVAEYVFDDPLPVRVGVLPFTRDRRPARNPAVSIVPIVPGGPRSPSTVPGLSFVQTFPGLTPERLRAAADPNSTFLLGTGAPIPAQASGEALMQADALLAAAEAQAAGKKKGGAEPHAERVGPAPRDDPEGR